jgi:hypothetical protein
VCDTSKFMCSLGGCASLSSWIGWPVQNPRYSFWSHSFTRCAPEIEKLFESVARSCMGPPLKSVDDDISGSLSSDGMKG